MIRKNSLSFPISLSVLLFLRLLLKSKNRLRYSLGIFYSSPSSAGQIRFLPRRETISRMPPRIYCALCASYRRIYVSFVAMHIYSRSQAPRSCRVINLPTRKGFSRNKYFVDRARVIVVDAIESSCPSFLFFLTQRFRPT